MSSIKDPKDKFELRDYLSEIELNDSKKLEERAEEIVCNIFQVMDSYRQLPEAHPLREYYELPLKQLELSYSVREFRQSFPSAIRYLLSSINWE
jgi:hypothetical protein